MAHSIFMYVCILHIVYNMFFVFLSFNVQMPIDIPILDHIAVILFKYIFIYFIYVKTHCLALYIMIQHHTKPSTIVDGFAV